jgi:hypothetical protein
MITPSVALFLLLAHFSSFVPACEAIVQITHAFEFPFVPFELGMRHIHTPEHIAANHRLTLPGFRLLEAQPPATGEAYTTIAFQFKTWFGVQEARMFTNAPERSNVIVFDTQERAMFIANLRVEPLGPQGHRLLLSASVFTRQRKELDFFSRLMVPLLLDAHSLEDALSWGYVIRREDHNLRSYRRRVLGKREPEK